MNEPVFEYFFDQDDLEPFYSQLMGVSRRPRKRKKTRSRLNGARQPPCLPASANAPVAAVAERADDAVRVFEASHSTQAGVGTEVMTSSAIRPAPPRTEDTNRSAERAPGVRTRIRRFVSVHALGQYLYCPRAAILAMETGEDRDIDEPLPRLTYLPNFSREQIEVELSKRAWMIIYSIPIAVGIVTLMSIAVERQQLLLFYPMVFLGLAYIGWLAAKLTEIMQLSLRRRAAIVAESYEPDRSVTGIQAVNWWSMLAAGYEPVNYQQPFRHPEYPIEGCPWRVLEKASVRIPVIRAGGDKLGGAAGELYPKYIIRLVAYAMLLESAGHLDAPFGLVFPMDSPKGLAVRITPALREKTLRSLEEFVIKLRDSQEHAVEPRPPEHRNRCLGCDYGEPEEISVKEIAKARKAGTRLTVLQHGTGRTYHCQCGDRFGSAPPHRKSIQNGLAASLD